MSAAAAAALVAKQQNTHPSELDNIIIIIIVILGRADTHGLMMLAFRVDDDAPAASGLLTVTGSGDSPTLFCGVVFFPPSH